MCIEFFELMCHFRVVEQVHQTVTDCIGQMIDTEETFEELTNEINNRSTSVWIEQLRKMLVTVQNMPQETSEEELI